MADLLSIPKGIVDFEKIIQNNFYYVDKTSFLKLLPSEEVALFTRPRRFGKTLNMSMIKYFFEMNYDNPSDISKPQELFKNLAISKDTEFCKQYMGQYPTISLSLKEVFGNDFEDVAQRMGICLKNSLSEFWTIFEKTSKLSKDTKEELEKYKNRIKKLADREIRNTPEKDLKDISDILVVLARAFNEAYHKKTIVLIDEYDVPLEKSRGKYYESMVEFIKQLFSYTFKDNNFLEKGFLTGCLRVSKESIFTGFNNPSVYDCTCVEYSDFFGFTTNDVKQMLNYYSLSDKFDSIKEWYDGYEMGNTEIYNPFSVNNHIKLLLTEREATPVSYWINSSGNDFLSEFINYLPDCELNDFKELLQGNTIKKDVNIALNYGDIDNHKYESMWSMLYVTGYLTKVGKADGYTYTLKIPNKEVRDCFKRKIVEYFDNPPEYKNYSQKMVKAFINREVTSITDTLNTLLPKYLGLRDVKSNLEYTYHSFMDGLLASSGIKIYSQKEIGDGVPDIAFTVKNSETHETIAVLLELKRADDKVSADEQCKAAIKQCHDKMYYKDYLADPSISHIYLYGIAFYKRSCKTLFEEVPLH